MSDFSKVPMDPRKKAMIRVLLMERHLGIAVADIDAALAAIDDLGNLVRETESQRSIRRKLNQGFEDLVAAIRLIDTSVEVKKELINAITATFHLAEVVNNGHRSGGGF